MLDILMSATERACQELLELAPCDLHLLADLASFVDLDLLVLELVPPPPAPPPPASGSGSPCWSCLLLLTGRTGTRSDPAAVPAPDPAPTPVASATVAPLGGLPLRRLVGGGCGSTSLRCCDWW